MNALPHTSFLHDTSKPHYIIHPGNNPLHIYLSIYVSHLFSFFLFFTAKEPAQGQKKITIKNNATCCPYKANRGVAISPSPGNDPLHIYLSIFYLLFFLLSSSFTASITPSTLSSFFSCLLLSLTLYHFIHPLEMTSFTSINLFFLLFLFLSSPFTSSVSPSILSSFSSHLLFSLTLSFQPP